MADLASARVRTCSDLDAGSENSGSQGKRAKNWRVEFTALADFTLKTSWESLPEDARASTELVLTDTLACILHGSTSTSATQAFEFGSLWADAGSKNSAYAMPLGFSTSLPLPYAAYVNGVAADAFDHNEGFYEPRNHGGHVGACIVPAIMAVVPTHISGSELLIAVLVGYEVAVRASRSFHAKHYDSYHSSGSWACMGAAAACARLLQLTESELIAAIQIAGWFAPFGEMKRSLEKPSQMKDSTAAGAKAAVEACLLAQRGITGCDPSLFDNKGQYLQTLGNEWTIARAKFKKHACCFWASSSVESAMELAKRLPQEGIEAISKVVVYSTFWVTTLCKTLFPESDDEACYGLNLPIALALANPDMQYLEPMKLSTVTDCLRSLALNVTAVIDSDHDAQYPDKFLAHVEIFLKDGTILKSEPRDIPEPKPSDFQSKLRRGAAACGCNPEAVVSACNGLRLAASLSTLQAALAARPMM